METNDIVVWLRGYALGLTHAGNQTAAERITEAADRLEDLKQRVADWMQIFDILNDRENRHHYLEYWRAKNGESDLSYPDGDEIYKDFFAMMADRDHLLEIAEKMHEWIFLHSADEGEAYRKCGLTPEDNARLGYGGQLVVEVKPKNE